MRGVLQRFVVAYVDILQFLPDGLEVFWVNDHEVHHVGQNLMHRITVMRVQCQYQD